MPLNTCYDRVSFSFTLSQNLTELLNVSYDDTNHYIRVKDANGVWHNAVYYNCNEPEALVPVMTSNTTPYGEAICNSAASSGPAYYAFDGNSDHQWLSSEMSTGSGAYIGYRFRNPVCIKRFKYRFASQFPNTVIAFKLQASNDGTTWIDISGQLSDQVAGASPYVVYSTRDIENSSFYLYYRLYRVSSSANDYFYVSGLQFYGFE